MQRSKASTFNFSTSSYFRASMARIFLIRKREELHSFTALFCTKASFYKFPFIQTPFFCVTISHTLVHNHKPWKIWPCRAQYFSLFALTCLLKMSLGKRWPFETIQRISYFSFPSFTSEYSDMYFYPFLCLRHFLLLSCSWNGKWHIPSPRSDLCS